MRNQLFPALFSVFALVSNPASSDNFKLPMIGGVPGPEVSSSELSEDASVVLPSVAMHVVLLLDVSPSMTETELEKAKEGLKTYFLSDTSLEDYSQGDSRAITVVSFSGSPYVGDTYLINSKESALNFIDNFEGRNVVYAPSGSFVELENGVSLDGGTSIEPALDEARKIFQGDHELGIFTENRLVLLIGDYMPSTSHARDSLSKQSESLTNDLGVKVCAISVSENRDLKPDYTPISTLQTEFVQRSDGTSVFVGECPPVDAGNAQAVEAAVMRALAMARL